MIAGGAERQDSVACGLQAIPQDADVVAIHDGARAYVTPAEINAVVLAAAKSGAAVLGTPVTDTVKRVQGDQVVKTLDRSALRAVQTPQAFRRDVIFRAHRAARESGYLGTDDTALVERCGRSCNHCARTSRQYQNYIARRPRHGFAHFRTTRRSDTDIANRSGL